MNKKKSCIQKGGLKAEYLENVAQLLKMLAHSDRLKIIEILERENEYPVHKIVKETNLPQAAVSLHLNSMKRSNILASSRKGKEVWYSIKDSRVLSLLNCICQNN